MEPGRLQNPVKLTKHQHSSVYFQDCLAQPLCSCRQQPEPLSPESSGICQGWLKPGSARTTWLLQNSSGVPALPPPPHDTRRCLSALDAAGPELIVWSHNLPHGVFTALGSPFTLFPITWNSKAD